jgi:hypothetical protein
MLSTKHAFPGARLHFTNASPPGVKPPWPEVQPDEKHLHDWVVQHPPGVPRESEIALDIRLGERLMAKLALALGAIGSGGGRRADREQQATA